MNIGEILLAESYEFSNGFLIALVVLFLAAGVILGLAGYSWVYSLIILTIIVFQTISTRLKQLKIQKTYARYIEYRLKEMR